MLFLPNAGFRRTILDRFPSAVTTAENVIALTLGFRYPFDNPAQERAIAGHLVDVLGELFDSVVGDHPGNWIEANVGAPLPTSVGTGAGEQVRPSLREAADPR